MESEIKPICDHPYVSLVQTFLGGLVCGDCDAKLPMPARQRTGSTVRRSGTPVQVHTAPINTANWQITAEMIARYESGEKSVYAPCIICGRSFNRCSHTLDETDIVWTMIKKMSKAQREKILNGS